MDGNLPRLALHVPEPRFRPGDAVDFGALLLSRAGEQLRPDETCAASATHGLCHDLIRVLGEDDLAHGPWNPALDPGTLIRMLRLMALTRAFDARMVRAQRQGKTSFYMKSTGEEATAVATALALADDDMVFPTYRQQGLLIARGYPLVEMVDQIFSNRADRLKGRQLPIMYSARAQSVFSISGNLATQIPQAVGWAMASAIRGDSRIATAFVGEGSSAEGDFHSGLTFAAVYHAPVVINLVNNQWAISSFSGFAGAERTTFAARAIGYGIAGLRVDGNDPLAVFAAVRWAADRARANAGPTLIEHFTYRAEGHSTSDDPGQYRSAAERTEWPLGDPVDRLMRHLVTLGVWDAGQQADMDAAVDAEVRDAVRAAEAHGTLGQGLHHPFRTMFEDVFETPPWHLVEQSEQAIRERRIKWPDWSDEGDVGERP
ncbi:branched-chain alpha-keto acid dehydrogenase E1 component [Novosphingobium nitrogenifigens DSM 19370]|uniref:2-oxoisovalerate dehydrogenase subunit alpha n=1 Tax=Novosphingobium nitrogenifigens DSM 19370 TaxID=983920 RepID=F1Z9S6_9SPHN|nr:thiamine pyrophosphate-dependent enzyme [Novosphingobium nitrogenifigens]EGD58666.1 branched-chain alpha-keto acid dehydrogenase E1 component [Novosphingobium nitrogenifigens DSM 19370]